MNTTSPRCEEYPDLFHSAAPNDIALAKATCARCPLTFRVQCLRIALTGPAPYGVFAGLDADELKHLRAHPAAADQAIARLTPSTAVA